jgi:glycerol-3-phosphate acyltransferase PlsX
MLLPSQRGPVIVLDVGATVDCRPENLRDFARMGSVYAQCVLHVDRPRVGLLSIGEEPSKGNALTKQAHSVLKEQPINFIGNVEGRHVAEGDVDVVVCDGFVGNAILKSVEGYAELIWGLLRERLATSWRSRLGAWMLRPALRRLAEEFDYTSYGGALLLGVNGICVIGHGRSTPAAVENAIRVAKELADQRVLEQLAASAERVDGQPPKAAAGRESDSQR